VANSIKRIAVIGPESTGKSELCDALAVHYQTTRVSEYARKYLSELGRSYIIEDIVEIYKTQLQQEQELITSSANFIFTDTEFIIAKVWCEHVFANCPLYIDEMIVRHPYDLYLLTAPDLPWEFDPLRENPGKGEFFFKWYKTILERNQMNFGIVSGTGKRRTESAIEIIEKRLINTTGFRTL
jgi:NadR type nicotinamide-nucleotide adenylyltransferase